ncbi:MAG: hypothetical protein Q7R60_03655 [bacterium]|nr:hypothetical protein [bacterium]
MVCIYCGGDTDVVNSRAQKRNNQVWRRRRCKACHAVFTSHEAIDLSSALVVGSGRPTPFLGDMLFTEVLLALQDRRDCYLAAREVTSTVIKELLKLPGLPKIEPQQISQATAKVLKRLDKRAHLRYLAEHPSLQSKKL